MYTVLVNDKKYCAEDGAPLKEILTQYGTSLGEKPGDCRVICPDLPISALDRRFLSPKELASGQRLADDKTVTKNLILTCPLPDKKPIPQTISSCSLTVVIGDETTDVCISDGKPLETISFVQPLLDFGDVVSQANSYENDTLPMRDRIREAIKGSCSRLLKKYGLSSAETTAVCASEFYLKILFGVPQNTKIENYNKFIGSDVLGLPSKKIYIVPPLGAFTSGEIFCQSTTKPENSLLIDCEKNLTLFYIGKEDDVYAFMWDVDYSELSVLMIRAALRVLKPSDVRPIVYLYGEYAYRLEDMLTDEDLSYIHAEKNAEAVAKACSSASFRSRLEKEKERTSFHDLLKDENFQEEMNNIYLYTE